MGSLMSGWSCQVHDPKKVKHMRNRSMTRVEIDAYWKTKKKAEEEEDHDIMIKSISSPSSSSNSLPTTPSSVSSTSTNYTLLANDDDNNSINHGSGAESKMAFRRLASMPAEQTSSKQLISPRHHHLDGDVPSEKSGCWWMASKWAFLNEPPVLINEPTEKPRRPYNYTTSSHRQATLGS